MRGDDITTNPSALFCANEIEFRLVNVYYF